MNTEQFNFRTSRTFRVVRMLARILYRTIAVILNNSALLLFMAMVYGLYCLLASEPILRTLALWLLIVSSPFLALAIIVNLFEALSSIHIDTSQPRAEQRPLFTREELLTRCAELRLAKEERDAGDH
jgi:hypothetical protein